MSKNNEFLKKSSKDDDAKLHGSVPFWMEISCETEMSYTRRTFFVCKREGAAMDYISIAEAAEKWGITRRRVQVLCNEGRIPGLEKLGRAWAIPTDANKPADARKSKENTLKSRGKGDCL